MTKWVNPFYKSARWRRARAKCLRRYQYECQETLRYGTHIEAETVHHIYPIEDYPELALKQWNLLPVTDKKHNTFHNRFDNTITLKGKYWQERRKEEFDEWKNTRSGKE